MKKGWVIGCVMVLVLGLVCAGVIAAIGYWGYGVFTKMTGASDAFLVKLGAGDVEGAYNSAAPGLQSQQTLAEFKAEVEKLGLTGYQASSWTGFRAENNIAVVEGSVTTKTGTIPLTVRLVQEGSDWKVLGLSSSGSGAGVGGGGKKAADEDAPRTRPTTRTPATTK